jgi:hypothetical protein
MGLFSLFGSKLPIDGEELEFQLATFKWLLREFGEPAQDGLITPTPNFFPSDGRRGVETLFEEVRAAAGMSDWPCVLRPYAPETDEDGEEIEPSNIAEEPDGPVAIVHYHPDLEDDAQATVALIAYQLAQYLMADTAATPPGGRELVALHAELAASYLGFGLFLANSARDYRQAGEARLSTWSMRTQGTLSEGALVTALVIVERLCGRDPMAAAPYLKSYLESVLEQATNALAKTHPDMRAAVEAIDLTQFGGTSSDEPGSD